VIVTQLSGGMKRKVNLGIALIGGSKVREPLAAEFRTIS
jgi:ABC-type multidrug transport system ATPase subunit